MIVRYSITPESIDLTLERQNSLPVGLYNLRIKTVDVAETPEGKLVVQLTGDVSAIDPKPDFSQEDESWFKVGGTNGD